MLMGVWYCFVYCGLCLLGIVGFIEFFAYTVLTLCVRVCSLFNLV